MSQSNSYQEMAAEAIKSAPPVAVTGAMVGGVHVNDWVAILTAVYVLLQIGFLLKREWLDKKRLRLQAAEEGGAQ